LYSPRAHIELEYVNEHIKILSNGSSLVRAELFVTNLSSSSINEIMILYPNRFISEWRHDEFNYRIEPSLIQNLTDELKSPDSKYNDHYNKAPGKTLRLAGNEVVVEEPEPTEISKSSPAKLIHRGIVPDACSREIFEAEFFGYHEIRVMDKLRYTHLTLRFSPSLQTSLCVNIVETPTL
jgi:hypothetical protein